MGDTYKGATVNIQTMIFNLQFLSHLCLIFMYNKGAESLFNDLSNDIYIFVGYIVAEILVKNRKLLTLIVLGTRPPLYINKIYPAPYFLLYRSDTTQGGS